MKYEMSLKMPTMPNFLSIGGFPPGRREDGFKEGPKIDVAQLTDEQLGEFIKEWGETFRVHVASRRKNAEAQFTARAMAPNP